MTEHGEELKRPTVDKPLTTGVGRLSAILGVDAAQEFFEDIRRSQEREYERAVNVYGPLVATDTVLGAAKPWEK